MIVESTLLSIFALYRPLQRGWTELLARYTVEKIAFYGLSSSLLFGYFLGCVPYALMDFLRPAAVTKYKVQQNNFASKESQIRVSQILLALFVILVFPMIAMFVTSMGMLKIRGDAELPSWMEVVVSIAYFFVVEDFLNYWIHRWLHSPWMYKNVHYVHHEHTSPFALAASYAHPVEIILLGIPTFAGPMLISPHLFTLWVWLMMRQYEAIDIHSGYEFPWNLNAVVKFYAGTEHHDYHHYIFSGNFASIFTWCDELYGTNLGYEAFKQKKMLRESGVHAE
mmetsp:Transcript_702/g.2332  ORF Transcript_702/g.2332 Transcript_702/m.2332 type:complete len:281 (+) Transcript_702:75-917(+)